MTNTESTYLFYVIKLPRVTKNRPDVGFDVRMAKAVQVMDIPMLKDFINALVMDSLAYGKQTTISPTLDIISHISLAVCSLVMDILKLYTLVTQC